MNCEEDKGFCKGSGFMAKLEVFVSQLTFPYNCYFLVELTQLQDFFGARRPIIQLFLGLFPTYNLSGPRRVNYNQIQTGLDYSFIVCLICFRPHAASGEVQLQTSAQVLAQVQALVLPCSSGGNQSASWANWK